VQYANQLFDLLGYYAALVGNSVPTFRDNLSVDFLTLEDGTDKICAFFCSVTQRRVVIFLPTLRDR
jgi:hypothetical protein